MIEIKPFDTLFFRDGKPFSMGEDSYAMGIFPPYPSFLYGLLRALYIAENNSDTKNAITESKALIIKAMFLKSNYVYLPFPADFIAYKDETPKNKDKAFALELFKNNELTNYGLPKLLISKKNKKVENLTGSSLIRIDNFKEYLEGNCAELKYKKNEEFIKLEPKIGIGRSNYTRATEESMLYRVGMSRLANEKNRNNLSLILDFNGLKIDKLETIGKLGAEGKTVKISEYSDSLLINRVQAKSNEFKIYLSTPAIFNEGWKPNEFLKQFDFPVELQTCALGKTISIGGFDMENKRPKPMNKAVPAGSVYYYKTKTKEQARKVIDTIHGTSISEKGTEKEGFGIAYCGNL